jgi:outer membrane protein OmpA-like peptidoglycan-associated protein
VTGTNPLVTSLELVPLYAKVGYRFSLPRRFFILPEAGAGVVFSTTSHYQTALDMLMGNLTISSTKSFAASLSLGLGWTVPGDFLDLSLGGDFEFILETGGPIFLPALKCGITLRPLTLAALIRERSLKKRQAAVTPVAVTAPEPVVETPVAVAEPPPEAPVETPVAVAEPPPEAPVETPVPEPQTPPLNFSVNVYFEPDTAVPLALPVLEDAVEKLRGNDRAVVELRGYAAPVGSAESCLEVSRLRALFCRDYFMEQAGIPESRIIALWYGSDKAPEWEDVPEYQLPEAGRPLAAYRCVEIIVGEE